MVKPRWKPVPNTHAFSGDDGEEAEAPEQWTIGRLDEYGLTEEIERLVNYVDEDGRSVAPPRRLVRAYTSRDDRVLHVLSAIATQPIVLADGVILGRDSGFEPTRGIHFMVPEAIAAAGAEARGLHDRRSSAQQMQFLTDDWLVDVKTNYAGKCVAIAEALTIIERSLLPERPVFVHTAGKSGSGKTTLIKMIVAAVTGHHDCGLGVDDGRERAAKGDHGVLHGRRPLHPVGQHPPRLPDIVPPHRALVHVCVLLRQDPRRERDGGHRGHHHSPVHRQQHRRQGRPRGARA